MAGEGSTSNMVGRESQNKFFLTLSSCGSCSIEGAYTVIKTVGNGCVRKIRAARRPEKGRESCTKGRQHEVDLVSCSMRISISRDLTKKKPKSRTCLIQLESQYST